LSLFKLNDKIYFKYISDELCFSWESGSALEMFLKFLLIFVGISLLELVLILRVGQVVGIWYTVLLMIMTTFFGVLLAKYQGFLAIREMKNSLAYGQMPGEAILDGLLVLIGGILLFIPGFITDIVGLLCLLPFTKRIFKEYIKKLLRFYLATGQIRMIIK